MYDYQAFKSIIFTEKNQIGFLRTRDKVMKLLDVAGSFRMDCAIGSGDGWLQMAHVDRLVEIGEIREVTSGNEAGQHRVFVKGNELCV